MEGLRGGAKGHSSRRSSTMAMDILLASRSAPPAAERRHKTRRNRELDCAPSWNRWSRKGSRTIRQSKLQYRFGKLSPQGNGELRLPLTCTYRGCPRFVRRDSQFPAPMRRAIGVAWTDRRGWYRTLFGLSPSIGRYPCGGARPRPEPDVL